MTTTTKRQDFLGRWLGNANPGTSDATDHLGRAVTAGDKDYVGRLLTFNNPAAWVTATVYAAGAYVKAASGTNYDAVYVALTAGTSDAAEPVWPTLHGTVADGSDITWKCVHG